VPLSEDGEEIGEVNKPEEGSEAKKSVKKRKYGMITVKMVWRGGILIMM